MGTSQDLTTAQWRKSSYSSDTGGDCVEVAVAPLTPHIALRDSKNPTLGALTVTPAAYTAFVQAAARGAL
ncbi:DUF397 domain-containing protein [Streptomyces sp. NBC_01136]|uniref:DUF397 domain-containing protein n=1 Tax=unclassified Streptomyces TaxID=2593676 RepID=UPI00324E3891|nr:DUF397 domain-containing protein [Streptomyces sp. NBC_01136]